MSESLDAHERRLRHADMYEVRAIAMHGPDTISESCRVSPHVPNFAHYMASAVDHAARLLEDKMRRLRAGLPDDPLKKTEHGCYRVRHPETDPGRRLTEAEALDMERCIATYAGRSHRITYYFQDASGDTDAISTEYAPLSMIPTGRKLAFLKRVVHVNPEDWRRPPLFIPTPWGVHFHMEVIIERGNRPEPWLEAVGEKLCARGMGTEGILVAVNEARASIGLPPWSGRL